jgi:hypothetical protein
VRIAARREEEIKRVEKIMGEKRGEIMGSAYHKCWGGYIILLLHRYLAGWLRALLE